MAHGGQTSLHAATSANPIKTVSLLIKHGGNVNVIDPWPESALHLSLSDWIEAEIWKITPSQTKMVKRRNTIRLCMHVEGQRENTVALGRNPRWTPLVQVAHHGRDDIFDLAVKKSLDVNAKILGDGQHSHLRLSMAANIKTPLTYAARNHHLQVVLLLLRHTEGVDFADESLRPAVTSAVAFSDVVFLELVIEKGKLSDSIRTVRRHFNAQQAWEFARRKVAA
ncbi:hypothetical protein KXV32_005916 [Aspergillus fumigatus]|nr:hypothetical protein KXV32_005916 [Aspergillus fumigatus]